MKPPIMPQAARDPRNEANPLVCTGCAHSAAGYDFPGRPSGERPCCFCIRNTKLDDMLAEMRSKGVSHFMPENYGKSWTAFYNNAPMRKCPMDCYISTDMLTRGLDVGDIPVT